MTFTYKILVSIACSMMIFFSAHAQQDSLKNQIALTYAYSYLNIGEWQQARIEYQRKIGKTILLGRYSIEERFGQRGGLAEIEAYPTLSEKSYAYLGAGFGNQRILPAAYFSGAYYHSLKKNFEVEIGGKWIDFRQTDRVTMLHTSLGNYIGNYWLNLRFTQIFTTNKTGQSLIFSGRRYSGNGQSYWFGRAGWSNTISEELIVNSGDVENFNSQVQWLQIGRKQRLKHNWILEPSIAFELTDWKKDTERIRLTTQLELKRRF